jgi:hypothetical protein
MKPLVIHWKDLHEPIKRMLIEPGNFTRDSNERVCGCVESKNQDREPAVLLCEYHRGWYDALNNTTAFRLLGAGR